MQVLCTQSTVQQHLATDKMTVTEQQKLKYLQIQMD